MRVAVRSIEGVETVEVSLNQGVAVIRLVPDNQVTIERIRQAIRRNGFTPRAADVVVIGRVVRESRGLFLSVPGQRGRYALVADPQDPAGAATLAEVPSERTVTIVGRMPETARGDSSTVVQVRRYSVRSPPP